MGLHRRRVWEIAKGFRGRAKNCYKIARQQAEKALQHAYTDRRNKKTDMRALWNQRINAATREHGVSAEPTVNPTLWCTDGESMAQSKASRATAYCARQHTPAESNSLASGTTPLHLGRTAYIVPNTAVGGDCC
jgi:hypothetical protein